LNAERAELSRASRDVLELRRQVESLNDKLLVSRVEGRTEKVGKDGEKVGVKVRTAMTSCWCLGWGADGEGREGWEKVGVKGRIAMSCLYLVWRGGRSMENLESLELWGWSCGVLGRFWGGEKGIAGLDGGCSLGLGLCHRWTDRNGLGCGGAER